MNPLKHLPEHKQKELAEIVRIIKEVTEPLKIILFGSHTTVNWVEDEYLERGVRYTYISDYDILVVLPDEFRKKELEIASKIENRTESFKNDVVPIVHTIGYINEGLERGQYFFRDIVDGGVILYDNESYDFVKCKPLTKDQIKDNAEADFEKWIKSGSRFLEGTKTLFEHFSKKDYRLNEVIFNLNQAAEKFYAGFLLVFTGYKPKLHRLTAYRKYAKNISDELFQIFQYPPDDMEERRLFKLLSDSYIDARYKSDYHVDVEDLKKLIEKVEKMEEVVLRLCAERIESLN